METIKKTRYSHIPDRLSGLVDLAFNLWWSWHPEARVLFKELNPQAWKETYHNPVEMLRKIPENSLEMALHDPKYLHRYDVIMQTFHKYMATKSSWFSEQHAERKPLTIAYFSAEYGLHHSLPFYAGGLGFLAGDHLKECSDLGVPLVAVGFMYSEGYIHQDIMADGTQKSIRMRIDRDAAPIVRVLDESGHQLVIRVPFIEPTIYIAIWKIQIGRVPLYLLDTDIEENDPATRTISHQLYIGDREQRLRQEIVLGIGGRKLFNQLGIQYSAVHLNEGHPAFALLERIRERVERGIPFPQAVDQVKGTTVFTTHTPVAAGHDIFPFTLIDKYFSHYYPALGIGRDEFLQLGVHPANPFDGFNMTAFAMKMSAFHNAVSKKHGEVTRKMWHPIWPNLPEHQVPIDAITNGVHVPTWLNPRLKMLFNRYFTPVCPHWMLEHDNLTIWKIVDEIPDEELWQLHLWLKNKLFNRIRERKRRKWEAHLEDPLNIVAEGAFLNPSILTIGFARRFATYKRADLIFSDLDRLLRILNDRYRPVQLVFAGKAHPDDTRGKEILHKIYRYAQDPAFGGNIAFVEDYGEQTAQYLVHGVDVWLNNPIPPMEASGTSGMKAALNGVLNLSILDGWWLEGFNGRNGWAFGDRTPPEHRDLADANAIYELLEREVVPLYYSASIDGVPHGWVQMMKESIMSNAPRFSTRRMVKEYVHNYYPSVLLSARHSLEETPG